jgi:hypothetical protein
VNEASRGLAADWGAVRLLYWLRARWRIENTFKYVAAHNGIDALAG